MNLPGLNKLAESWWLDAWPMYWQSSLAIGLALVVTYVGRGWPAQVRYAILMLPLLKLLLPPITVETARGERSAPQQLAVPVSRGGSVSPMSVSNTRVPFRPVISAQAH